MWLILPDIYVWFYQISMVVAVSREFQNALPGLVEPETNYNIMNRDARGRLQMLVRRPVPGNNRIPSCWHRVMLLPQLMRAAETAASSSQLDRGGVGACSCWILFRWNFEPDIAFSVSVDPKRCRYGKLMWLFQSGVSWISCHGTSC